MRTQRFEKHAAVRGWLEQRLTYDAWLADCEG